MPPQNSTSPPAQSACLLSAIEASVQLYMLMAFSLLSHQSVISKMVLCISQRAIAFKTIQAGRTCMTNFFGRYLMRLSADAFMMEIICRYERLFYGI